MNEVVHIITTICLGGAEKQLVTLMKEQVRSGRKVTVVYLKGSPELENAILHSGSNLVKSVANLHPIIQIFKIRKFLSRHKKIIIHAHLPRAELLSFFVQRRFKIVITRHNSEKFFPKAPRVVSKLLSRLVFTRAAHTVAISEAVKKFLTDSKEIADITNLSVVHYGFEVSTVFQNNQDYRIDELANVKFLIGTVARLVPQKDLETLIEAFAIFVGQNGNAKLLIVGDGHLKQHLVSHSSHLGVANKIIWFGRVENIPAVIRTLDIFALTSLYEGFGLVLLEAMAEGIPIVASRNSAIPEVLGEEYEGLFETGNAVMLAKHFEMASDPNVSLRMKTYLTSRMEMFEPRRMSEEIDAVYSRLEIL